MDACVRACDNSGLGQLRCPLRGGLHVLRAGNQWPRGGRPGVPQALLRLRQRAKSCWRRAGHLHHVQCRGECVRTHTLRYLLPARPLEVYEFKFLHGFSIS
jgi:hypothetical protein